MSYLLPEHEPYFADIELPVTIMAKVRVRITPEDYEVDSQGIEGRSPLAWEAAWSGLGEIGRRDYYQRLDEAVQEARDEAKGDMAIARAEDRRGE